MSHVERARAIWDAAVAAVDPRRLVRESLERLASTDLLGVERVIVVGAGKAGAAMSAGVEDALVDILDRVEGIVNVPAGGTATTRRIVLHPARPAGSNFPTAEGVDGAHQMLTLSERAGANDIALCLISGGGSALLPAPVEGVSLADKQTTTKLLHASGATINEMNAVRKHLSRIKGGGLARAFRGRRLISLIISDVVGDPLDVIASGPTAPDPTTFADAWHVLERFKLLDRVPGSVREYLAEGCLGRRPETTKTSFPNVENRIIGNNGIALAAAESKANQLGYAVLNLGTCITGDAGFEAAKLVNLIRQIRQTGRPIAAPCCLLAGGESTVDLGSNPGKGGRNQEFVLASLLNFEHDVGRGVTILSAGTDGEDGPTDAAGAVADIGTLAWAKDLGLNSHNHLVHHDAYPLFERTGNLIRSGLTGTNVMDIVVALID